MAQQMMRRQTQEQTKLRQGQFSYLPELTDEEIQAQIQYAIDNGWAVAVEYTNDPHPRNTHWEMWERPMFQLTDASEALEQVNACREAFPDHYVAVTSYDNTLARQLKTMWFIVQRPDREPGFRLDRTTYQSRTQLYSHRPYEVDKHPSDQRYEGHGSG